MRGLSPRQQLILQHMGVDVWQRRTVTEGVKPQYGDNELVENKNSGAPDSASIPNGNKSTQGNVAQHGSPQAAWWFIHPISIDTSEADDHQANQLYRGILHSVGLEADLVLSIDVQLPSDPDFQTIEADLRQIFGQGSPQVIFIMGEKLAQLILNTESTLEIMRTDANLTQHDLGRFVVSHSLQSILHAPLLKAEVWQDLIKARSLVG